MKKFIEKFCKVHGEVKHFKRKDSSSYRCSKCASDAVAKRRREIRKILVEEHGGKCSRCGYDKSYWALEFHHQDKNNKLFSLSVRGLTMSLAKAKKEMDKCILLCANCHREIEHEEHMSRTPA